MTRLGVFLIWVVLGLGAFATQMSNATPVFAVYPGTYTAVAELSNTDAGVVFTNLLTGQKLVSNTYDNANFFYSMDRSTGLITLSFDVDSNGLFGAGETTTGQFSALVGLPLDYLKVVSVNSGGQFASITNMGYNGASAGNLGDPYNGDTLAVGDDGNPVTEFIASTLFAGPNNGFKLILYVAGADLPPLVDPGTGGSVPEPRGLMFLCFLVAFIIMKYVPAGRPPVFA